MYLMFLGIFLTGYSQNNISPRINHLTMKSTDQVTYITSVSAISGGTINSSDDGLSNIARGLCWSSSDTLPTIDKDIFTSDGIGDGRFISAMFDLIPNTTYYVRTYTTYPYGTTYGPTQEFVTKAQQDEPIWCVGVIVHKNARERLEIIFNMNLLPLAPDPSAFTVLINNAVVEVKNIDIIKNKVFVNLNQKINENDVIVITYIQPTTNPLRVELNYKRVNNLIDYTVNNILTDESITTLPFII